MSQLRIVAELLALPLSFDDEGGFPVDSRAQLMQHLEHSPLDGIEELEEEDMITGAVVLLRVERPTEEGTKLLSIADVDFFSQLGLLTAAKDLLRVEHDEP